MFRIYIDNKLVKQVKGKAIKLLKKKLNKVGSSNIKIEGINVKFIDRFTVTTCHLISGKLPQTVGLSSFCPYPEAR